MKEVVTPRGSRFLLCQWSHSHPKYAKYPPQPVVRCGGYQVIPQSPASRAVIPLYQDPFFTFRFADDRIIPRFHLDGMPPGRPVQVFSADPDSLAPIRLLTNAIVGEGGWVDLPQPIVVRAGEVFVVFPKAASV